MEAKREPVGTSEIWLRFLVLLPVGVVLCAWTSLAFGAGVSRWHLGAGWLLATGTLLVGVPDRRLQVLLASLGGILLAGGLMAWSLRLYDFYFDSQAYHLPAAVALRDGWNPLHEGHPCSGPVSFLNLPNCDLLHGYPKGAWLVSAATYDLLGDFEGGKFLNLWTLLALYLSAHLLFSRFPGLSRTQRTLFSLAIAANPVALSELGSAYVDVLLVNYLGIFVLAVLDALLFGTPGRPLLSASSLVLLVNLKFTGLAFGLIFCVGLAAAGLALGRRDRVRRLAGVLTLALALGVLVVGYDPYVTNFRENGNPFYPAVDFNRGTDVIAGQVDAAFLERNRVERFVVSLFSVPESQDWRRPRFQAPLSTLSTSPLMGERFGGFGPLFSAGFLGACALLPFLRGRLPWYLLAAVAVSVFAVPTGWWARLTPQVWWLPLTVAIPVAARAPQAIPKHAARLVLLLLVFNASVKLWTVSRHQWRVTAARAATLERIVAVEKGSGLAVAADEALGPRVRAFYFTSKRRLADRGLRYVEVSRAVCSHPLVLEGLKACPALVEVEPPRAG